MSEGGYGGAQPVVVGGGGWWWVVVVGMVGMVGMVCPKDKNCAGVVVEWPLMFKGLTVGMMGWSSLVLL
jgi:hypothetical protein